MTTVLLSTCAQLPAQIQMSAHRRILAQLIRLNSFMPSRLRQSWQLLRSLVAVWLCGHAWLVVLAQTTNPILRVANTTLALPQVPQSFGYKTQPALGALTFSSPVAVRTPPGETNRLFVVEQGGRIFIVTNLTAPTKTLFLDLSKQIIVGPISGLFALAFHPGYQTNGYLYVGYNLNMVTTDGSGPHYRVSRFTVSPDDPGSALTNSELPLINQRYTGNGFCDDMLFGLDGYLYIAVADPNMDSGGTAQAITANLYGGILRIDVDQRPGSLAPNSHPAVTTNYLVPPDNPFVGATNFNGVAVNPAKLRTEYYAVGLRNPWRMSLDPLTGLLFVGDPGTSVYDEINVVTKGGNYGWPYREGTGSGPKSGSAPAGVRWVNPIYQRAAGAIIGGVVYRGQDYPQLQGAYVFADYVAGQLLNLRYAGTNLVPAQTVIGQSGVAAFGVDPSNNDVLVVSRDSGKVLRLTYSTNVVGTPLPATLADTGAFSDLAGLTPNPGIVGYDINVPFWSDNAIKTRWFSLPALSSTLGFSRDGAWSFPVGTVWIKHFDLELTNGVPESTRRLETRLLVRTSTGIYGATYRWGDSLTNAGLVQAEGLDETFTVNDGGTIRTQVWHYPGRNECLTCHTPLAGFALGFNTAQLNLNVDYPGGTQNQLRALSDAGYFSANLTGRYTLPALAQPTNTAISVDYRVRSYLAANCVQCHQPGGAALGYFDARLTTPLSASGLMNGELVNNLGDPANSVVKPGSPEHSVLLSRIANLGANHMPPLATSVLNQPAIDLMLSWISNSATNYESYADWQQSHFGSTSAPGSAPWQDPDGDGAVNQLEYLTGTNPSLAGDAWGIHISASDPDVAIQFTRIANRGFEVQWTTNLLNANSWTPLDVPGNAPVFGAANSLVSIQDTPTTSTKYYRVRVFEP
jgi:glucose/arabinose dehydrogenase